MRSVRGILAILIVLGFSMPTLAQAQGAVLGKEVAKKLFEEGLDLEKKADYVAALAHYKDAEQITATPGLRFHKGYCLEMLGKLNTALEEYELADKLAREANKADVHAAVAARAEPLRARIPQIAIRLAPVVKDADVQLDGSTVAPPLLDGRSFRLDPGDHVVTARAPGHRNFVRRVTVPEAVTTSVDVLLDRAMAAPAPSLAPLPIAPLPMADVATPEPERSRALPIATTVGAVALLGAGIALFEVAGSTQRDGRTSCLQKTSCDSEQSKVRAFDALALGGFVGAAALGVVSIVLWTSAKDRSPAVVAKPSAVVVEGSF